MRSCIGDHSIKLCCCSSFFTKKSKVLRENSLSWAGRLLFVLRRVCMFDELSPHMKG